MGEAVEVPVLVAPQHFSPARSMYSRSCRLLSAGLGFC